VDHETSFTFTI